MLNLGDVKCWSTGFAGSDRWIWSRENSSLGVQHTKKTEAVISMEMSEQNHLQKGLCEVLRGGSLTSSCRNNIELGSPWWSLTYSTYPANVRLRIVFRETCKPVRKNTESGAAAFYCWVVGPLFFMALTVLYVHYAEDHLPKSNGRENKYITLHLSDLSLSGFYDVIRT